jgi:hypothetical protein
MRARWARRDLSSTPLGNMYLANRYSQTTCDDKVHAVPLRTRSRKITLSDFPSTIYLRQKRPWRAIINYVRALKK